MKMNTKKVLAFVGEVIGGIVVCGGGIFIAAMAGVID